MKKFFLLIFFAFVAGGWLQAQTYTPIGLSGFNHDVFAETYPDAVAATDTVLDFTTHIMYTAGFAASAGLSGGINNSGLITDAGNIRQFQLAPFNGPNALTILRSNNRTLSLTTPAPYNKLSVLCFSTEGASNIGITLQFADGTSTAYVSNYTLPDWFNNTTNVVISGFGRCQRFATAPYNADGFSTNPRFYYVDINLNCADRIKTLQNIVFSNNSVTGTIPFPNAVFLAVSGAAFTQNITASITPATCASANGGASLSISGNTGPYSVSWNTTPSQSGTDMLNVNGGNYTATIIDAAGCTSTYNVTVPQQASTITATATATPAAICNGGTSQLSVTATGGTLANYTWNPGSLNGSTVTVTPGATTVYTVSGQDQFGCNYSANVTVTINPPPAAPGINGTAICSGLTATLTLNAPVAGETYNWYTTATGGTSFNTGNSYTTPALTANTTYYIEAVSAAGCISAGRTPVTVTINPLPALPALAGAAICPGDVANLSVQNAQTGYTYNWYAATSGGSLLATGTSFQTPALSANTNYYVEVVSNQGCISTGRASVTVTMLQPVSKPIVSVSAITANSVTFSWQAVAGATGYEISVDGGLNFITPSTGATGTAHTITGLIPGQTVSIVVRALGPVSCQNSVVSDKVSALIPDKNLFVPNVFTPNGDGHNDVLLVYSNSIATMDFRVFNQWGQEVFQSSYPSKGWDGNWNGKPQTVGVYVYTLKVKLTDGTAITKKGSVSLLR